MIHSTTPVETALHTGTYSVPAQRVVEAGSPALNERVSVSENVESFTCSFILNECAAAEYFKCINYVPTLNLSLKILTKRNSGFVQYSNR